MVTKELSDFIRSQMDNGIPTGQLSEALVSRGGWSEADVAEAISQVAHEKKGEALSAIRSDVAGSIEETTQDASASESVQTIDPLGETEPIDTSLQAVVASPVVEAMGTGDTEAPLSTSTMVSNTPTTPSAAPTTPPEEPPEPTTVVEKKLRVTVAGVFMVVIAIGILVGVAGFAYSYFFADKNLSPVEVLHKTVKNLVTSNRYRVESDIDLRYTMTSPIDESAISADGSASSSEDTVLNDDIELTNRTIDISLNARFDALVDYTEIDAIRMIGEAVFILDAIGDTYQMTADGSIDYRISGDDMYVRIVRSRTPKQFVDFGPIHNTWIQVSSVDTSVVSVAHPDVLFKDYRLEYARILAEIDNALGEEDVRNFLDGQIKKVVFEGEEDPPVHTYEIMLDSNEWKQFLTALFYAVDINMLVDGSSEGFDKEVYTEMIEETLQSAEFDRLCAMLSGVHITATIEPETYNLKTIALSLSPLDIDVSDGESLSLGFDAEFRFSPAPASVTVDVPSESMTFVDALETVGVDFIDIIQARSSDSILPQAAGKVWVGTDPAQCLYNPWEQDWIQKNDPDAVDEGGGYLYSELYPRGEILVVEEVEERIIKDFFAASQIAVHDVVSFTWLEKYGEDLATCDACECPEGYSMYLQVDEEKVVSMLEAGFQIADI